MGKLNELVSIIEKNISTLDKLDGVDDYIKLNAVLHLMQVAIQAMIDLGSRVVVELGYKIPSTYSELPLILKELNAIDDSEVALMRRIIGFRNIVVHGYTRISITLVKRIMEERKYRDILILSVKILNYALDKNIDP